jgi:uncharacterized repeat protein (TIGR01451 family)
MKRIEQIRSARERAVYSACRGLTTHVDSGWVYKGLTFQTHKSIESAGNRDRWMHRGDEAARRHAALTLQHRKLAGSIWRLEFSLMVRLGLEVVSVRCALLCGATATGLALAASVATAQSQPTRKDGELVALCTPGLVESKGEKSGTYALYDLGYGRLGIDEGDAKLARTCVKATAGNLGFKIGSAEYNLSTGVEYDGADRSLTTQSVTQTLCQSFYTGSDGYQLRFRNSNGDVQGDDLGTTPIETLRGVGGWSYDLASRAVAPDLNLASATQEPWLRCFDASQANGALDVDANGQPLSLFDAGFESSTDVQVEFLKNGSPAVLDSDANGDFVSATIGSDSTYRVRVVNRGEATAENVRVREFIPKSSGQISPRLIALSCQDESAQTCAGPDGTLTRNIAQLAPGEARVYTLTRKVDATTETSAPAMVAAFVDPSNTVDEDQADNKRKLFLRLVANGLPSADPKTISTSEDVAAIVTLSGTDPDPGDTVVAWNVVTPPQHGSLSGTAPNLTYTPAMDYNGADSFTYRVVDNRGGQGAPATVSITISAVNDAPRIATQMADVTYAETAAVEINAANAFVDPEGDAFTVAASGLPSGVSYFAGLKVITGTLNQTSAGTYNVVLTATETASGLTANNTFTLTVTDTNQTPTVATPIPDQASNEGATPSLDVAGNFSDADANNTLTFSVTAGALPPGLSLATNGQVTGTISQTAATGSPYTITVTANDGSGTANNTVSDTFAWTVNAVNVAPVAGTLADRMGTENDPLEILGADLRAAFSDPDDPIAPFHDTLAFSVSGLPAGLIYFGASSNISGIPAYGTDGIHVITVTATDPGSLTASQTFQLTIGNANRLPTVANPIPNQAATAANAFNFQFAANTFSDPDTDEATTPDVLVYTAQLVGGGALPAGCRSMVPLARSPGRPQWVMWAR